MARLTLFFFFFQILLVLVCNGCMAATLPSFPAILILGDSTVDTGNNNYLPTLFKGNHYPYGLDFPGRMPTGRFSDGKLVPDFIASELKIKETVPPFLDPNLSEYDLRTGVSFASGGSGYDDLTSLLTGVIPMSQQMEYFKCYLARLKKSVGVKEAMKIVNGALVIISSGTNDFGFNFYDIPTRRNQFNIGGYQDFLHQRLSNFIEELYHLGCRTIVVSGIPPIGCLPIQRTIKFQIPTCINDQNSDAQFYNAKLNTLLPQMQASLPGSKILYADVYTPFIDMINRPHIYGFVETKRGCCGTGFLEAGPLCNIITPPCLNPSQHLFWDSVHPTEAAYRFLAKSLIKQLQTKLQSPPINPKQQPQAIPPN